MSSTHICLTYIAYVPKFVVVSDLGSTCAGLLPYYPFRKDNTYQNKTNEMK